MAQERRNIMAAKKLKKRKKEAMKLFGEQLAAGEISIVQHNENPYKEVDETYADMGRMRRTDDPYRYTCISTVQQCYGPTVPQHSPPPIAEPPTTEFVITDQPSTSYAMSVPRLEVRKRSPGGARRVQVPTMDLYPVPQQVESDSASEYSLNTQYHDCEPSLLSTESFLETLSNRVDRPWGWPELDELVKEELKED